MTGLALRVARLNPRWNETCEKAELQRRFEAAPLDWEAGDLGFGGFGVVPRFLGGLGGGLVAGCGCVGFCVVLEGVLGVCVL